MKSSRLSISDSRKSRRRIGVARKRFSSLRIRMSTDDEADAPQPAAHQAHAEQPGHQEVDVPAARLVDRRVA